MAGEFDLEAFKAQLKEELLAENRKMMKELMGEMIKLVQGSQPIPPTGPVDVDIELPMREGEKDEVTVLADPIGRKNVGRAENIEQSDGAKNFTKAMTQMEIVMKEKCMTTPMDYADLDLDEEDDPLPQKFKFPNIKKYSGTDDPYLHLKLICHLHEAHWVV